MTGFKAVSAKTPEELEEKLNTWAKTRPPSFKVKRTQLAASNTHGIVALVNYETREETDNYGVLEDANT